MSLRYASVVTMNPIFSDPKYLKGWSVYVLVITNPANQSFWAYQTFQQLFDEISSALLPLGLRDSWIRGYE